MDSVISNSPVAPPGGEQRSAEARTGQKIEMGDNSRASQVQMTRRGDRLPDATLLQSLSLGSGSTAEDIKFQADVYTSEKAYYFELLPFELIETAEAGAGSYERLSPGAPLRAGRTYRVRVSLSKNEYRGPFQSAGQDYRLVQRSVNLPKEVFFHLGIVGQDQNMFDAVGDITPGQSSLSVDDLTQFQDFEFTVQKDYQLEFTIELRFSRGDHATLQYQAATLTLTLGGKESPPPPALGEVLQLSNKVVPPPDTAVLLVSEGSEGSLMLRGWLGERSDGSLSLEVGTFGWVDPQDCPDEEAYLQKLRDSFYDYNTEQATAVVGWFEKALGRFGEQCSIVIVDVAGALIPWEMFKLSDGRFLGAHALIVRWAEAQYGGGGQNAALAASPKYEGRVSAYVHPLDVQRMCALPEMHRLLPHYNEDTETLEDDLLPGEGVNQVGLVYLCYGGILYYGDEQKSISHLSRYEPYKEDVLVRFNLVGGMLNPRPIFFANAPYSGRMLKSGQKSCGLARAVLKQVAASYIGTLGPVEHSYAARFAQKLLQEAASEQGVKPAELLRRMRVEAIARVLDKSLPKAERARARKEFVYPFMYVHYGHPHDWLKISCTPEIAEAEGGDEHV